MIPNNKESLQIADAARCDIFEFYATARVTCASQNEMIDPSTGQPKSCSRVELQIVGMCPREEESEEDDRLEEEEVRSRARRMRFYGNDGEAIDPGGALRAPVPSRQRRHCGGDRGLCSVRIRRRHRCRRVGNLRP